MPCASIAVLYRAHYVSRSLEDALFKAGIPYVIWGGMEFYGRREIKDALCYLRMLENRDDLAFARVVNQPRRGVGFKRMELLKACARSAVIPSFDIIPSIHCHIMMGLASEGGFKKTSSNV